MLKRKIEMRQSKGVGVWRPQTHEIGEFLRFGTDDWSICWRYSESNPISMAGGLMHNWALECISGQLKAILARWYWNLALWICTTSKLRGYFRPWRPFQRSAASCLFYICISIRDGLENKFKLPCTNTNITLDSNNAVLVDKSVCLSNESHNFIPCTFCLIFMLDLYFP